MAEAVSQPRFEMRGVGKRFGATIALDAREPGGACRARCALWSVRTARERAR